MPREPRPARQREILGDGSVAGELEGAGEKLASMESEPPSASSMRTPGRTLRSPGRAR
jgi:hypothetical protein